MARAWAVLAAATSAAGWELGDPAEDGSADWLGLHATAATTEQLISRPDASIRQFQPAMPLPAEAGAAASSCPQLELQPGAFHRWEDPALLWGGGQTVAGPPAADGTDVLLPDDTTILVSAGALVSTAASP